MYPNHPRRLIQNPDFYLQRLALPDASQGRLSVVIDTDAANEIDDQFALTWALLRQDRLDIQGIYAAPFSFAHRRAMHVAAAQDAPPFNPPDIGMQRSFDEILTVQALLGLPSSVPTFKGSTAYLRSLNEPIRSDATDHLLATARAMQPDKPLYVVTIGCCTNIASALLLAPDIAEKIVVVWTSAYPSHAPHINQSFNLEQDVLASQWLYDSGVPLVYLPGYHVGAQLRLSAAEVERFIQPHGAIGCYLHELFSDNPLWSIMGRPASHAHSWVIWDLINFAWLINPAWVPSHIVNTPALADDLRWQRRLEAHPMREAFGVDRDAIFNDLIACLASPKP